MKPLTIAIALGLSVGGIAYLESKQTPDRPTSGEIDRYFTSPQASVDVITDLLKSEDWRTLASYYDLSGTGIDDESLLDSAFFLNEARPEAAHPAGFWRYKQPFAPGYTYLSSKIVNEDQIEVTVMIEIDEGGGMVQRGLDAFRLTAHPEGYQLLPKE